MQLPFFFEEALPEGTGDFQLSTESSKHIVQVLRMKAGDKMILTDGQGQEMTVFVKNADKNKTIVSFESKTDHLAAEPAITIAISPLKNAVRFEWFVEKATELGISGILPLICSRTEKKSIKTGRLKNIMISAMIQSRQVYMPELQEEHTFEEIMKLNDYNQKYIATLEGDFADLKELVNPGDSKIILIGPEGDFSPEEVKLALKEDYLPVTLGNQRLRTETAGLVAAVMLRHIN